MTRRLVLTLTLALAACSGTATPADGGALADAGGPDSGVDSAVVDAFIAPDAGPPTPDAGPRDAGPPRPPDYMDPMALGTTPAVLPETSGIVSSRTHPGVFWVENDSGNPADIFAIDSTAHLLATIHVGGATNVDWEDLTITANASGGDDLYVTDTGDNIARMFDGAAGRPDVQLYRLAEPDPALGDQTLPAERITLTYPDRPYDCEAVFVEHTTGDVYLVTKEAVPAEIFVARAPLTAATPVTLEHVGTIDVFQATAADMSRDGMRIAVRGYSEVRVYTTLPAGVAATLASPTFLTARPGSAAEAICFPPIGYDLYTIAEGTGATLYRIPAP